MGICTGKGDGGISSLCGGISLSKSDIYFDVLGNLDELSAVLALVKLLCENKGFYENVQKTIIKISAYIATKNKNYMLTREEAELPEAKENCNLKEFTLSGETELCARINFARTVCRRAERSYVLLEEKHANSTDKNGLVFLNRLSDALYIMGLK